METKQGEYLIPRIGNDYQAVIPPLYEGTKLSVEETEAMEKFPPFSAIEKYTFLLALYIFGKNLSMVMKFVTNKSMMEIQGLYYGEFYGSYEYRIWSEWGKWRGKRCSYGEKLFTECRLNELMSRLLPFVSKQCQDLLTEISIKFWTEKISFVEFIFKLKDSVGVPLLIEAFGIGKKGIENLTSSCFDTMWSEKDWSSVTPAEILKLLNSFQNSNKPRVERWRGFFWEAIWPRLVELGWQCQQPKGLKIVRGTLLTSLIFLVPSTSEKCTNKFSWSLEKGTHYHQADFKNMLKIVASDPSVLGFQDAADDDDSSLSKMAERRFLARIMEICSRENVTSDNVDDEMQPFLVEQDGSEKDSSFGNENVSDDNGIEIQVHPLSNKTKGESRIIIDLNFAYVHDVEADHQPSIPITMGKMDGGDVDKSAIKDEAREEKEDDVEVEMGEVVEEKQEKKSVRSRPLTKKAWEALENEFVMSSRKKRREAGETSNHQRRPSDLI